jgi:hypothetical protein
MPAGTIGDIFFLTLDDNNPNPGGLGLSLHFLLVNLKIKPRMTCLLRLVQ